MKALEQKAKFQKKLTPYEKVLKAAASEAQIFNRQFDNVRSLNKQHFQAQSVQMAHLERPQLDSFVRKRHSQFLTNFY